MSLSDIHALVPHAGQMVLLDRILDADDHSLRAEVRIHAGSVFADEFGVGAWVGIEYMAQAIAAHAGWLARQRGEAVKAGFLLGARRYETSVGRFVAGSILQVLVKCVLRGDNGLGAFECRIDQTSPDGSRPVTVAAATVTVFQPDNIDQYFKSGKMACIQTSP